MFYPTVFRTVTPPSWDDALGMRREFDRWLDRSSVSGSHSLQAWTPLVDVSETDNAILVTAELAGVNPADVNVTVQHGILTISGEKMPVGNGSERNYHMNERRYGKFERSFSLLQSIVQDDVQATFSDGLLTVTLPKTAEAKPRRIQVESADRKVEIGSRKTARVN